MRRLPLVVVLSLAPIAAGAQQADTHAIVGARVITVSGPVYDSATLVMRDGLITAVGPDVTPPPGARVTSGKGLGLGGGRGRPLWGRRAGGAQGTPARDPPAGPPPPNARSGRKADETPTPVAPE